MRINMTLQKCTKVKRCHDCGDNIYSGDYQKKLGRGKYKHLICPVFGGEKEVKLTLGDKVINFILEMVKR